MIAEYYFTRQVINDIWPWKWDLLWDVKNEEIEEYLYWENLAQTSFTDFFKYFTTHGDLKLNLTVQGINNRLINKLIDSLKKDVMNDYANLLRIYNEETIHLTIDDIAILARNTGRGLCHLQLIDLNTNIRYFDLPNADSFMYELDIDEEIIGLDEIFSTSITKHLIKVSGQEIYSLDDILIKGGESGKYFL